MRTKKLLIVFFLMILLNEFTSAQITFQKTYGGAAIDYGSFVQQTNDGGYLITGSTNNFGAGAADVYLIKTDIYGDTLWTKTFGSAGDDMGNTVQQTSDGGYIISGISYSFGIGAGDVYLIKTDINGNLIWAKYFGGTFYENGWYIKQTVDGGYIITGISESFGAGSFDVLLMKTDSNGSALWTQTFGGIDNDASFSVQQTSDGGYIICGQTKSFGTGNYDVYLIKTDTIGNSLWTKTFGGADTEIGNSVQQTTDGGYIICGYTLSFGSGNIDVYLIKTDTNGNTLWTKTFGGIGYEIGSFVQQTTDGGYIICGHTQSFGAITGDVYLIKTDTNGDTLWTKTFGGIDDDNGVSVQQTADGGYIICCGTKSFGAGDLDIYLIKTDSLGNSGCNEANTTTIVNSPVTLTTNPATFFSSPSSSLVYPLPIVGNGGIVTTLCSTVGINEIIADNSLLISPNPSTGNFAITFENIIRIGTVQLFNVFGKNIFEDNIFNQLKKEITLDNISTGIYFIKVFDGKNNYTKKLIIE